MDAQAPFSVQIRRYIRSAGAAIRAKPLLTVVTVVLVVLLLLHLGGTINVDGWAIILFFFAVLPWALPTMISTLEDFSEAFGRSSLKSVQIGNFKIEQLERKVSEHAQQIDEQRRILDDLALYSMGFYIYDKLKFLYLGTFDEFRAQYGEYKYVREEAFDHDLRYLRDHGYLELFQIHDLNPGENLVGKLKVTEMGQRFVELKEGRRQRTPETVTPAHC